MRPKREKKKQLTGIVVSLSPYQLRTPLANTEAVQENNDRLIKKFIKKVKKSEVIREALDRRFYKKPSQKRHDHNRHVRFVRKKVLEEENKQKYMKKEQEF